ncbi:MAG: hypothetical protein BGN96_06640 [Bacteroidales bacterium 45-6]|nr:MAG: hypothetical protein BGN96_06640 [Bacteroidales bacterium 45-6]
MRKSDIYEFAIKILGLYLVVSVIEHLREVISYATILIQLHDKPEQIGEFNQVPIFIVTLFNFLLLTTFAWLLIFKTRKLTSLICTKEDYSETTKLFADKKTIIEIAIILVGLMTVIWTIPEFAIKLKNYVYMSQNSFTTTMNDKTFLFIGGLKIVVGIIAISYAKSISSYVSKEKNNCVETDNE